jgi:hypothetical protein
VNRLRVHFFFSTTRDLAHLLQNTMIEFRITDGDSWDRVLTSGKSLSLREFVADYATFNTSILPKSVYVFTPGTLQHTTLEAPLFFHPLDTRRAHLRQSHGCHQI